MKNLTTHIFVCCLLLVSCNIDTEKPVINNTKYDVKINFIPKYGNDFFSLNTDYTNAFSETFNTKVLKWYVSNWEATNNTIAIVVEPQYFLVDVGANNLSTTISTSSKSITQLSFLLGVDSVKNVSGAQSGALDPVHSMFWTWNTGYIMFKMEGVSPQSNQVNNKFEYHIGGFSGINSVLRRINVTLNSPLTINQNKPSEVDIVVDIAKFFNATNNLKIADNPVCTTPGTLAKNYADNYASIFTVRSVRNF